MWAVREAGIGALSNVAGGPNLPQAFVEDTVVAVDRLPPYIRELDELFAGTRDGGRLVRTRRDRARARASVPRPVECDAISTVSTG